jgi:hypothetical protein
MASKYDYHSTEASAAPSPYGSVGPSHTGSTGYLAGGPVKRRMSPWIKFGIPIAVLVIVGAVVGGVVGSRKSNNNTSSNAANNGGNVNPSAAVSAKNNVGRFAISTDTDYFMPVYPSTVSCFTLNL